MRARFYTWCGNEIAVYEHPFSDDGWQVESEDCSVPESIAKLLTVMATYGFWNVVVDGVAISRIK